MAGSIEMYGRVDENVATNLRRLREIEGLSQEDLAQRMTERGHGFSQATIWKIEQGKRPVKISELVALADSIPLRGWHVLLSPPDDAVPHLRLQNAHRRAYHAYATLKAAATTFLEAQEDIAITAQEAYRAGDEVHRPWTAWLQTPAERAVLEARIELDKNELHFKEIDDTVERLLEGFRDRGYQPLIDLDAIERGATSETDTA